MDQLDSKRFKEFGGFKDFRDYRNYERSVNKALGLIRKGHSKDKIIRRLNDDIIKGLKKDSGFKFGLNPEDIYEIAHCRIKAKEKFGNLADKLFFDEEGLRYSTPEIVAEYRAKRLKCDTIADISCGVGAQLIFFARFCKKVYGIEIDRKRAFLAHLNAMRIGLKNIEIIEGNAFNDSIVERVRDADVFFSDPARPPSQPIRTVDALEPNPLEILEKYGYDKLIAFELPPQMPPSRVPIDGEKEYVSLNFKLNRMAVYTNTLAEVEVSAVSLPTGERVSSDDHSIPALEKGNKIRSAIYEVDPSIIKAELLPNLIGKLDSHIEVLGGDKRRTLISSDDELDTAFLRKYKVLDVSDFNTSAIRSILKKLNAGKVTIRFHVDPAYYWDLRNKIEKGLKGDKWIHLFRIEDKAIVTQQA